MLSGIVLKQIRIYAQMKRSVSSSSYTLLQYHRYWINELGMDYFENKPVSYPNLDISLRFIYPEQTQSCSVTRSLWKQVAKNDKEREGG